MAAFGRLTDSLAWLSTIFSIAKQDNLSRASIYKTVEIGGVEPPKPRLTARQGEPATPTAGIFYHGREILQKKLKINEFETSLKIET